jgi:hypothetical protein
MPHRGPGHEFREPPAAIREPVIASIVNGAAIRDRAGPPWVTDKEVGERVVAILNKPRSFPDPILRIARWSGCAWPVFSSEASARVQGLR